MSNQNQKQNQKSKPNQKFKWINGTIIVISIIVLIVYIFVVDKRSRYFICCSYSKAGMVVICRNDDGRLLVVGERDIASCNKKIIFRTAIHEYVKYINDRSVLQLYYAVCQRRTTHASV